MGVGGGRGSEGICAGAGAGGGGDIAGRRGGIRRRREVAATGCGRHPGRIGRSGSRGRTLLSAALAVATVAAVVFTVSCASQFGKPALAENAAAVLRDYSRRIQTVVPPNWVVKATEDGKEPEITITRLRIRFAGKWTCPTRQPTPSPLTNRFPSALTCGSSRGCRRKNGRNSPRRMMRRPPGMGRR